MPARGPLSDLWVVDVTVLEWLLSLLSCHQPTAGSTGSSLTTLADCVQ